MGRRLNRFRAHRLCGKRKRNLRQARTGTSKMADTLPGGVESMALSLEEPPTSLLSLPDAVLHALCALLEVRGCLALRSACLVLRSALTGADADLGVWKPRVLALAPTTTTDTTDEPPLVPSAASYEEQYAFLHRYAYLVGDYRWPQPVIGGLVRVELQGAERLRATLTTRPRVGVGSRYTSRELFRVTRADGLVLPATCASVELAVLQTDPNP